MLDSRTEPIAAVERVVDARDAAAVIEAVFRSDCGRLVALAQLLLDRQVEAEEVVQEAFARVLPEPLAGRQLIDGADPTHPRAAEPADILQIPTALPADMTPQSEWLEGAWSVCYASTTTLCSQRLLAGATVATLQAPGLGSIVDALEIPVGDKVAAPPDGRNGIDWLLQHWIWPDPSTPPFLQVTVHARPALIFDRPGAADRLGDTVVLWTEGTAPDIDDTSFSLGVSKQMGLSAEQLVALAESMQPAG